MKKFSVVLVAVSMAMALSACATTGDQDVVASSDVEASSEVASAEASSEVADSTEAEGVMTYEEYIAADLDTEVVVETYVQAKQSWWDNKATFYAQDENGAYFIYNMPCSESDYADLEIGTQIRVKGYKSEWAGEVEITDAEFEILGIPESSSTVVYNLTDKLGTDELIEYQNFKAFFKDMTVVASVTAAGEEVPFMYGWDGSGEAGTDADLYFNAEANGVTQTFVVEYYTCDDYGNYGDYTDYYSTVQGLQIGDKLDIHCFMYWYEGAQPHVIGIMQVG